MLSNNVFRRRHSSEMFERRTWCNVFGCHTFEPQDVTQD